MYIIELIIKKLTRRKQPQAYNPLDNNPSPDDSEKDYEACEHVFMPIDSTNELLSCTKCGILIKRSELKNKNFFRGG